MPNFVSSQYKYSHTSGICRKGALGKPCLLPHSNQLKWKVLSVWLFFFFCSRKQVVYSLITQQQLRETYSCTHAYKSSQTCSGDNWQIRFILFSSSLVLCPFLMLPCATTHITHFKNCHFMNIFKKYVWQNVLLSHTKHVWRFSGFHVVILRKA